MAVLWSSSLFTIHGKVLDKLRQPTFGHIYGKLSRHLGSKKIIYLGKDGMKFLARANLSDGAPNPLLAQRNQLGLLDIIAKCTWSECFHA